MWVAYGDRDFARGHTPGQFADDAAAEPARRGSNDNHGCTRGNYSVSCAFRGAQNTRDVIDALSNYGRPDALSFNCLSYEFGLKEGTTDTVYIVERWGRWEDLDALLRKKVVPALPLYNELLKRPFDPAQDTLRIELSGA